jgi:hypothetical protein
MHVPSRLIPVSHGQDKTDRNTRITLTVWVAAAIWLSAIVALAVVVIEL